MPRTTSFPVAQPFRAAEGSPVVGQAIAYFLSTHGVAMALSAGRKPRSYEEKGGPAF
jgi:hypothetical protein